MVDSLREVKLNAKEKILKMIIEKITHMKDKGDLFCSNPLFLKKKRKHMEQKIFKDIP